jgi:hypothetical protein
MAARPSKRPSDFIINPYQTFARIGGMIRWIGIKNKLFAGSFRGDNEIGGKPAIFPFRPQRVPGGMKWNGFFRV